MAFFEAAEELTVDETVVDVLVVPVVDAVVVDEAIGVVEFTVIGDILPDTSATLADFSVFSVGKKIKLSPKLSIYLILFLYLQLPFTSFALDLMKRTRFSSFGFGLTSAMEMKFN